MFGMAVRPLVIVVVALVLQSLAVFAGDWLRRRHREIEDAERKDIATILPAALTLLTLLIGFSFSMAANRYDQRKMLEEAEANAIGTEYMRADLVPGQAAHIRALLSQYTAQRILFYEATDPAQRRAVDAATATLQAELWAQVVPAAIATPTPVLAVVVSGMNDVLNSQSYTQAMFWNRLPPGTWFSMLLVAGFCSFLFGYSEYRTARMRLWILPVIVALPLGLIADMDSPRYGIIHVVPQNLLALQATLH
jgi:hypothetical protein